MSADNQLYVIEDYPNHFKAYMLFNLEQGYPTNEELAGSKPMWEVDGFDAVQERINYELQSDYYEYGSYLKQLPEMQAKRLALAKTAPLLLEAAKAVVEAYDGGLFYCALCEATKDPTSGDIIHKPLCDMEGLANVIALIEGLVA